MKLAVSSYSYGKYVNDDNLGIAGVMDHAKSLGFDAIEIVDNGSTNCIDAIRRIREHSEKIGLPVVAFDVGADFTKNDCRSYDEEIERVIKLVDFASELGAPIMRHDVSYGNFTTEANYTFENTLELLVKCCRTVADYAQTCGVKTMFENHGHFIQHHTRVEQLIKAVNHPNFGYLLDIGNFMCVDDDPVCAVTSLAQHADHVHLKDFHYMSKDKNPDGERWFNTAAGNHLRGAVLGEGSVDVAKCLKILDSAHFDNCLSLEFEGVEDNLYAISKGFAYMQSLIHKRR